MWLDVVVRETYRPDFWKIAFTSKAECSGTTVHQLTAVSVNVKHIDVGVFTTEPESSLSSHPVG